MRGIQGVSIKPYAGQYSLEEVGANHYLLHSPTGSLYLFRPTLDRREKAKFIRIDYDAPPLFDGDDDDERERYHSVGRFRVEQMGGVYYLFDTFTARLWLFWNATSRDAKPEILPVSESLLE